MAKGMTAIAERKVLAELVNLVVLAAFARAGSTTWCGQARSMSAGDSSPLRRIDEMLPEGSGVLQRAKAIPHRVSGEVHIHVPLESAALKPIENIHGRFVERQRHLKGKVPVYLENRAHFGIENITRTIVNGARGGRFSLPADTRCWAWALADWALGR